MFLKSFFSAENNCVCVLTRSALKDSSGMNSNFKKEEYELIIKEDEENEESTEEEKERRKRKKR